MTAHEFLNQDPKYEVLNAVHLFDWLDDGSGTIGYEEVVARDEVLKAFRLFDLPDDGSGAIGHEEPLRRTAHKIRNQDSKDEVECIPPLRLARRWLVGRRSEPVRHRCSPAAPAGWE